MIGRNLLILSAFLFFTAATCERPVELVLPEPEPRLVVISNFTTDEVFQVLVSQSRSVLDQDMAVYVTDAKVDILEGGNFLEELKLMTPPDVPPFHATTDLRPQAGVIYTLRIEAPGFPVATAQSKIPESVEVASLEVSDLAFRDLDGGKEKEYSFRIDLGFQDLPEVENYYHLQFFQQVLEYRLEEGDTMLTGGFLRPVEFSVAGDNNSVTTYFSGGVLFADIPFDGQFTTYGFRLRAVVTPRYQLLGQMFAELRSVSEEYYLYHRSLSRQQDSPGAPFSEPVIVFNNIENGHGIFAGYSVSRDSVAVLRE